MKPPYEHDWLKDEIVVSRGGLRLGLAAFLLLLLVPALSLLAPSLRSAKTETTGPPTLKARLASWEESAKTLPLFENWRREDQALATRTLRLGNAKVHVGHNGWLHYRPDLEALFGRGPYHSEPPSVARERHERAWQPPLPVIEDFAAQLAERNIRLVFVPVPTKAMACREGLGLFSGITVPRAWPRMADELSAAGIGFVDLFPTIASRTRDDERFLKQDTHWTPGTMEAAAREVAARIQAPDVTGSNPESNSVESLHRSSQGDLVEMLDLGSEAGAIFEEENALLRRVVPTTESSPEVVLLGDSFVNVFDDPELGFDVPGEESIGAGFAAHLATALGRGVGTVAINGGGATAVREAFATFSEKRLSQIRTVVWVLSARDVLLPELPARRAGIEWRTVEIGRGAAAGAASAPSQGQELVATLREKSAIEDPKLTPYASAIYSTIFEDANGSEHLVFLWAFRDRQLTPEAALKPGRRFRLRLLPLESEASASRATRLDDFFRPDLAPRFADSFELLDRSE